MGLLEQKATALNDAVTAEVPQHGTDFSVWLKLILSVFQALADCKKKPEEVANMAKSPGVFGRRRLRQLIRNTMPDDGTFKRVDRATVKAVLEEGKKMTTKEARQLFAAAKKEPAA